MRPFKLIPSISFSEKDFTATISKEKWEEIKESVYQNNSGQCYGCGYCPVDKKMLQIHLHWWDEKNYDSAEFMLLCEACHAIKHIDVTIANGWAVLVNSVYTQEEIIRRNRSSGAIRKDIDEHKIVLLKKTLKEYYEEIELSELHRNEKTKILFGNKFAWKK